MPGRRLSLAERDEVSGYRCRRHQRKGGRRRLDAAAPISVGGRRARASGSPDLCQPRDQAGIVPRSRAGPHMARENSALVGPQLPFPYQACCPRSEAACHGQAPPPQGDGCGRELDWWFTEEALHPPPSPPASRCGWRICRPLARRWSRRRPGRRRTCREGRAKTPGSRILPAGLCCVAMMRFRDFVFRLPGPRSRGLAHLFCAAGQHLAAGGGRRPADLLTRAATGLLSAVRRRVATSPARRSPSCCIIAHSA